MCVVYKMKNGFDPEISVFAIDCGLSGGLRGSGPGKKNRVTKVR